MAVALISLVIYWPTLNEAERSFRLGFSSGFDDQIGAVRMVNARFFGQDVKRQPFTITATEARQLDGDPNDPLLVRLTAPQADITLNDNTWIALTAAGGIYDKSANSLELEGGVNIFHDQGYELFTNSARVDLARGEAWGAEPVRGQGPFGTLTADQGFEMRDNGAVIMLKGPSKLVLEDGWEETAP